MDTSTRNQLKARKAVAAALDRHKVFVCSARFRSGLPTITRVLVARDYFDVSDHQLAGLREGMTPKSLGLAPVADEPLDQ